MCACVCVALYVCVDAAVVGNDGVMADFLLFGSDLIRCAPVRGRLCAQVKSVV